MEFSNSLSALSMQSSSLQLVGEKHEQHAPEFSAACVEQSRTINAKFMLLT